MLCIQRRKQDWKWCGSIRARTRPMVSWEGMPLGSARNVLSQSYLSLPYCSISTGPSAPQISAQIVSVTISIKRCSFVRSTRGSSSASKCSMMVDVGISNTVSIVPFLTNPVPFHHFTSLPTESRCDDPILRNHMIMHYGIRDSAYYSIIEAEWPDVKEQLVTRLYGDT